MTKITRKLVALVTGLHIQMLRRSLWAYKTQVAAALRTVNVADQAVIAMQEAQDEAVSQYEGARREELQAQARYAMEAETLGRSL